MKRHLLFFAILIAFGCTESDLTFNPAVAISDGTPELVQTFGGSKNDVAKSVVATTDGGFAVLRSKYLHHHRGRGTTHLMDYPEREVSGLIQKCGC